MASCTGSRDTYVHFVQDPFDIASIVRPYVKWEYSLPSGVVVKEALARASAFVQSDPPGPVYMMLPRETLAEEWDEAAMPSYPPARYGSVKAGGIEPARVEAIADATDGGGKPDRADRLSRPQGRAPSRCWKGWRKPAASGSPSSTPSISISRRIRPALAASIPLPLLETRRSRPATGFRRAVRAAVCQARARDEMDPDRHRPPESGFSDVGLSDRHAGSGRQRHHPAAGVRCRRGPCRRRYRKRSRPHRELERRARGHRSSAAPRPATTRVSPARSIRPSCSRRWANKLSPDDIVLNEAIRNGPVLQEHLARTKPAAMSGSPAAGSGFPAAWRWD